VQFIQQIVLVQQPIYGGWPEWYMQTGNDRTVQTLYHCAKISFFALRGDCAHEKYLFILGVRD
jgi:hypothetical protein